MFSLPFLAANKGRSRGESKSRSTRAPVNVNEPLPACLPVRPEILSLLHWLQASLQSGLASKWAQVGALGPTAFAPTLFSLLTFAFAFAFVLVLASRRVLRVELRPPLMAGESRPRKRHSPSFAPPPPSSPSYTSPQIHESSFAGPTKVS